MGYFQKLSIKTGTVFALGVVRTLSTTQVIWLRNLLETELIRRLSRNHENQTVHLSRQMDAKKFAILKLPIVNDHPAALKCLILNCFVLGMIAAFFLNIIRSIKTPAFPRFQFGQALMRRFSINLDQHRVVHIGTESILNRNQISPVAVGRDLYAMAKPSSQVVNEFNGAVRIALANQPRRDNLRIGVDGNPSPHIAPSLGFLFGRRNLFFRTTKRPNFINLNSPTGQPAKHNVLHLAADSPISHSDRKTVFFATPVMRTVARTEVPSTKHRIT